MTRILLAEDHPLVRHGLRSLLEMAGFQVCGEAESRAEALQAVRTTRPDLLLVDLTLWGESGLDVIRDLRREEGAAPRALVYSMHEDWLHVRQAFQAGAEGYVTKRELPEVLLEAVRVVLDGGVYTSPRAAAAFADPASRVRLGGLDALSAQEEDLFRKLGEGLGMGELAEQMGISRKTAESYCDRLLVKLDLKGMKVLRLVAIACGKDR
jgi:DNA-binding NarL/FixJ family response regulator